MAMPETETFLLVPTFFVSYEPLVGLFKVTVSPSMAPENE